VRFTVGGHEIDYETRGEGRTLFFVHGLAADRMVLVESCEPVFAGEGGLSGWRRVYLDLPGHGASTANRNAMSADDLCASLAALLHEVGGERPCLLGHSYGGYLAQGMLRLCPGLSGLLLANPVVEPDFGKRRVPPARIAARADDLVLDPDDQADFGGESVLQTPAMLELFRRVVRPGHLACDREALAATRARYLISRPLFASFAAFAAPVSIIAGHNDAWVGFEDALPLVRTFPDCRFAVVPKSGHLMPLETPAEFRRELTDWLRRCGAGAG
jgi:pimeloyl-ACP methyl ester carboxylesterase